MDRNKKIIIGAIVAVAVIILAVIIINGNKKASFEYLIAKSNKEQNNTFIESYKDFNSFVEKNGVESTLTSGTNYKKYQLNEYFNKEYFDNKKVAVIPVYEDTSKAYVYKVDAVSYNENKTSATITYTYKSGEFTGTLDSIWYNYMFVELEKSVTDVKFERIK